MEETLRRAFLLEIANQSNYALYAIERMSVALSSGATANVFFYAQAFLVGAGNLSKIFWPSNGAKEARGLELRQLVSIPDESPLAPSTFRNHFEHFDERLEEWASSSNHKNIVDNSIVAPGSIKGIDPSDFLRNLDPRSLALTFRGDQYDLQKVAKGIFGIRERVATASRRKGRL